MFEGIRDRNIWLYFPIVYRIKKYPISETKWNMTGHFVGKGKYLCKGRKNSFNTFLRYSYFQLTTSLYINPQVVYITQHTHTDLELILKRILKIMISKGVAGTKNSFSVFNFEVMTQSILYPYIHWYSFLLLQSIFYAYIAEQKRIIHWVFVRKWNYFG